jgi:hypothetical protein
MRYELSICIIRRLISGPVLGRSMAEAASRRPFHRGVTDRWHWERFFFPQSTSVFPGNVFPPMLHTDLHLIAVLQAGEALNLHTRRWWFGFGGALDGKVLSHCLFFRTQSISRRHVKMETPFQSRPRLCDICDGKSDTATVFHPKYHFTSAAYSYSVSCCCYRKDTRSDPRRLKIKQCRSRNREHWTGTPFHLIQASKC